MRLLLLCLALLLGVPRPAIAQTPVTTIEELQVEIWPDYDQPAVLVLLTGRLGDDVPRPAEVTLPLPRGATLNAVARISDENVMVDDIEYSSTAEAVTLVTPDRRFRVEYYVPYETAGTEKRYTFVWQAELDVNQLAAAVQEPAAATALEVEPAASDTRIGPDGLTYHSLVPQAVPAGEQATVTINYTLGEERLTAEVVGEDEPLQGPAQPEAPGAGRQWLLWLAAGAGVLALFFLGWQLLAGRQTATTAPGKPRRQRPVASRPQQEEEPVVVRYCHQCGQAARPGDRFCRNCGTRLKRD